MLLQSIVYISVCFDMPTLILHIKVMESKQMSSACFPPHLFTTISQLKRGPQQSVVLGVMISLNQQVTFLYFNSKILVISLSDR